MSVNRNWIFALLAFSVSNFADANCPDLGLSAFTKVTVEDQSRLVVDEIATINQTYNSPSAYEFQEHIEKEFARKYGGQSDYNGRKGFFVLGDQSMVDNTREATSLEKIKDSVGQKIGRKVSIWASMVPESELKTVADRKRSALIYFYPEISAADYHQKQCEQLNTCLISAETEPVWTSNPLELEMLLANNGAAHKANLPYYVKTIASLKNKLNCSQ